MGLLDGLSPVKQLEPCKVGRTIIELEPSDAQVLIAALEDPRWAPRGLSKALSSRGVNIAPDTLQNHMKKMCRCSKI
jgi:hypothetical protein